MFNILYKYFILNRRLYLPGIGVLTTLRQSASLDYGKKAFIPPSVSIDFKAGEGGANEGFYNFLCGQQQVEKAEAVQLLQQFTQQLNERLTLEGRVDLPGLGTFIKKGGKVQFEAALHVTDLYPNISIDTSRRSRSNLEMVDADVDGRPMLASERVHAGAGIEPVGKSYWWVYAIVLAFLSIAAIAYYYFQNGNLK